MNEFLEIRGAREHNLKDISLKIPRDKMTVITGLSGSGKSSLAFDTIYAEGQRRYVESLTSYARQFLGQMDKPDVDTIEGLSPAISIDQKTTGRNPRSTVGTVTEIHDYLRLLWARVGVPHCPVCGREIRKQSVDEIVDAVCAAPEGTRMQILSPLVRGRKGEHRDLLASARKSGYVRVRIDGEMYDLEDVPELEFSAGDAREWLRKGSAGIAASGTITVEATILGLPVVVAYKLNWLTWQYAKRAVKLPSITIANLVTKETVFEERLQHDANPQNLASSLADILPGGKRREQTIDGMKKCVRMLGENWPVSDNVAKNVLEVAGLA